MKYRIETMKPNIYKKKLHSDILNQDFKIWISMKARKCLMKSGSLDNYLLHTNPKNIHSKFGLHLRALMKEKLKNPDFKPGYIQGTAAARRTRVTKNWQYKQIPTMYIPARVKAKTDLTLMYEKPPSQMSRYELQELERVIVDDEGATAAPELPKDADGKVEDREAVFRKSEEFHNTREEISKIQPLRIGIFKRYWKKFRYNRHRRELLIELFDETDKQIEFYLGDEFVSWKDHLEGTREFLKEIDAKKVEHEQKYLKKGDHLVKNFKGGIDLLDYQEIQYDIQSFNPLDATNVKLQESHINKTYYEKE